jgi:Carboxypeptidase regulatory-like domain/TonB dependent receptor/TonB-dependent Receptor Plug Domain
LRKQSFILLFVALVIYCLPLHAQTTDTAITGIVTDSSGAVIPGATVTVSSPATGIEKKTVTNSVGHYSVNYLTPGTYDVTVSANGFTTFVEKGIVVQIDQQVPINAVKLGIATNQQMVEVQGTSEPLLQSEDASLGVVVGTESAQNLPLNGRKFDDLAILTPGITVTDPDNHSSGNNGASINSYGGQVTWAQVYLDGISMTSNRHAYVNLYPSVDAVQEFKVYTGNAEAEYGGTAGSVTNIQLKSGGNAFHGDLFEFLRNTVMDARNYFRPAPLPKQVLKQNQFGATLGGPIRKDRTFFFISYEGLRSIEQIPALTNVPTAAEINGDFSALLPKTQLKSPYTGLPYANNHIPVDTVSQNIAKNYIPLPNTNLNGENYSDFTGGNETVNQIIGRVDHKINESNQLAFHLVYANRTFPEYVADPDFGELGTYPAWNSGLQYIHTFSSTLVNELRLGTDIEHLDIIPNNANGSFTPASIGINGFVQPNGAPWPPSEEGFPIISVSGLITVSNIQSKDYGITYQLVDNVTWSRGKHTLIFGGDIRHNQDNADTSNTPFGSLTFSGSETGNAIADFILGVPASVITPEGIPITSARGWRYGLYFEDNWKATPNLTVNAGIRYDLTMPPHDDLNTSETLDWNTSPPTLVGLPTPLWKISHKDFSPRVGFAYSLPHQFVVRGAYGLNFYGGDFDNLNALQLNPPADPSFTLTNGTNPSNPPTSTINNPVSPSITPGTPNVVSLPPGDQHPDLYAQIWNLTLSKQFWSNVLDVSYVGVKGEHQDTSIPYFNSGLPQPANLPANGDRPYPTFGSMRLLNFEGASIYEGLNVHFQHRLTHNLDFTTAYSWSHLRDNQGGDTNGVRNETQIPTAKEWANGLTDQRQNLTIAFVYQLPKLTAGNVTERALLNGWAFNSIFQFLAGSPIFITQSKDGENNGNVFERPDLVPGQALTVPHRTVQEWFNTAAFTEAVGHYGSTPRNPSALVSPANDPLTLAISRTFATPFENQHVEFRCEVYNALNTPQFTVPAPGSTGPASVASQGSSSFGVISSTGIDNREVQLALKYIF